MAIRKIVKIGDDCLRQECRKQEKFDLRLKILLKDMADTMYKAEGAGLAAPQVTYIMHALAEHGMNVKTDATTIEEAATEIMRSIHG